MREITITANDAGRRLDRFLRKYLPGASLGEIYKIIRKDARVGDKRKSESYILSEGDILRLYLSDNTLEVLGAPGPGQGDSPPGRRRRPSAAKRTFGIVHEDDDILVVNKPYGLLTHGDAREKKDHLANQVKDYLISEGAFDPGEKVFTPAPVNRLDRNTTGLVLFGKTAAAMRELNRMIRDGEVRKFYLTAACGEISGELRLTGGLTKDEAANRVTVTDTDADGAKEIETLVRPLEVLHFGDGYAATLCEVELLTGRTHQIRAHLASAGHPLIGDSKYADRSAEKINRYVSRRFGLTTQLLHAYRIEFAGRTFEAPAPKRFKEILRKLK